MIFLVGLINFLPLLGVLSKSKLETSYGITIDNPNLEILLRHRAVLFGIIGGFIIYSVFQENVQTLAIIMAFLSMVSFLLLMLQVGSYNSELKTIMSLDIVGLILLVIAVFLKILK